MKKLTLLINCKDQPGIIAATTNFISNNGGNIIYVDQHVDRQQEVFFMRIEFEFKTILKEDFSKNFEISIANNFQMNWKLFDFQKLFDQNLIGKGSRIIGLTSEGNYLAMEGYGPVSVAKVAMEAIIRQIGWELGEYGITANSIQAGITPTRALTKITDRWETWVENTKKRNPMRRTTTPNDVANTVKLLMQPEADFINCSIIYCDGGEHRSGSF